MLIYYNNLPFIQVDINYVRAYGVIALPFVCLSTCLSTCPFSRLCYGAKFVFNQIMVAICSIKLTYS